MAGREMSQKRKKHIKSRVSIPALAGRPFAVPTKLIPFSLTEERKPDLRILLTLGHILLKSTSTQLPPILACTPYQMQAMAPLLNVHHKLPQIPKLVLATTGKVTW